MISLLQLSATFKIYESDNETKYCMHWNKKYL